jgi:hypothetical protein
VNFFLPPNLTNRTGARCNYTLGLRFPLTQRHGPDQLAPTKTRHKQDTRGAQPIRELHQRPTSTTDAVPLTATESVGETAWPCHLARRSIGHRGAVSRVLTILLFCLLRPRLREGHIAKETVECYFLQRTGTWPGARPRFLARKKKKGEREREGGEDEDVYPEGDYYASKPC